MRIGIDLDNVLNNLNSMWLKSYNADCSDTLTIEDIHSWDIHKYTKNGHKIYEYLNEELFRTLSPLHDAVKATKELSENHSLFIVTASSSTNLQAKWDWLKEYFPHIPEENYIVAHRKDLVNVDVLIDDGAHNLIDFPNEVIVMDYAWNRHLNPVYIRAHGWDDIVNIIRQMEKEFE